MLKNCQASSPVLIPSPHSQSSFPSLALRSHSQSSFLGLTLRPHSQSSFPGLIPGLALRPFSQSSFPGLIPRPHSQASFPVLIPCPHSQALHICRSTNLCRIHARPGNEAIYFILGMCDLCTSSLPDLSRPIVSLECVECGVCNICQLSMNPNVESYPLPGTRYLRC